MDRQRRYNANENNKKDPAASTKALFAEFLKENPYLFHRATLHKKLIELGYSREL